MWKANQDVSRLEHKTKLQFTLMQQPNYLIYIINIQKLTHFKAHQNLFISDLNHSVISLLLKLESLWSPRRRHTVLRTKLCILPATSDH